MSAERPTCGNCPYYDESYRETYRGEDPDPRGACRTEPVVVCLDGRPETVWRRVLPGEWCSGHPVIEFLKQQKMVAMFTNGSVDMMLGLKEKLDDAMNT